MFFRVLHQLFPGSQVPFPPGGDDLDIRLERVGGQLEPHLVIALARGTVGNGVGAGSIGRLHQVLGDKRAGN